MHQLCSHDKDTQYEPIAGADSDVQYDHASRSIPYLCQSSQCMRGNKSKQNQCCLFFPVKMLTLQTL